MTLQVSAEHRRRPAIVDSLVVVLACLITLPLLASRGFALVGDMVFVPRQPWKEAWLGADGSVPRAVPSDALVSMATHVIPGDILQKFLLFSVLVAAGWGMTRLVANHGPIARVAAATLYVWNPYVYERLAIGHWALLCGYAALPWVLRFAMEVRDGQRGSVVRLVIPVAVAAWSSPTGGVLASLLALVTVLGMPRAKSVLWTLAVCLTLNLPWIVPGVLYAGGIPADPTGVAAFAAKADTPFGTLGSLLSLGGIWKSTIAAPGRETWFLAALALALTVAALAGLIWSHTARRDRSIQTLAALSLLCLLVALLPSTELGESVLQWVVVNVPGGGLVRDSQKWIAPLAVLLSVGVAHLVTQLGRNLTRFGGQAKLWLAGIAVLPIAILPGLAFGMSGQLQTNDYPDEWGEVRHQLDELGASEARTVVLPFEIYRRFSWNGERAVLDPAPRFFPGQIVVNDTLTVGGSSMPGEDPSARAIRDSLVTGHLDSTLREESVRFVIIEKDTPSEVRTPDVEGSVVHDGPQLKVVELETPPVTRTTKWRGLILAMDGMVLAAGFLAVALMPWRARRRLY